MKVLKTLPIYSGVARACGDCRMCCRVFGVTELAKRPGAWCEHACSSGCSIYETRPQACRDFACLWLQGFTGLLEDERPDKMRLVPSASPKRLLRTDGREFSGVTLTEGHAGASLTARAATVIRRILSMGLAVIVMEEGTGKARLIYPDGHVETKLVRSDWPSPSVTPHDQDPHRGDAQKL